MKRIIIICAVICPMLAFGQSSTITLNSTISGNKTYEATGWIKMEPGFSYTASSGYSFLAKIVENIPGDTRQNPIVIGQFPSNFQYPDTKNTNDFTNAYIGRSTNDVFYKFAITQKMNITIKLCNSSIDTYLYLLDASGELITQNNDYDGIGQCGNPLHSYLFMMNLEAGTYYVVTEGFSQNGLIAVNIEGAINEFDYPNTPPTTGNNTSDNSPVGITTGAFDVGATGAATYNIPIAVPPGLNGLQPSIAVVYNSQAGNGIAGWGCNLTGMSVITRRIKTIYHNNNPAPVYYIVLDALALDGQPNYFQEDAVYNPENDPFPFVVVKETGGVLYFEVVTKEGMTYRYGYNAASRLKYQAPDYNTGQETTKYHSWYLDQVVDPFGNFMSYTYETANNYVYLKKISYGYNMNNGNTGIYHHVEMTYGGF